MKTSKKNLPFIGLSSLFLFASSLATAAETSHMDHSGMDMSGMDHSGMDMSGMDHSGMDMSDMGHSSMDMSNMQGGEPPADARSPDYSQVNLKMTQRD